METETKKLNLDLKKVVITLLLVLLSAGAVGGGTYYVLNQNFQREREANEAALKNLQDQLAAVKDDTKNEEKVVDETVNWKTYRNNDYNFSFKYPNNYSVKETKSTVTNKAGTIEIDSDKVGLNLYINPGGMGFENSDYKYTFSVVNSNLTYSKTRIGTYLETANGKIDLRTDGKTISSGSLEFSNNNWIVFHGAIGEDSNLTDNINTFELILSSFRFN